MWVSCGSDWSAEEEHSWKFDEIRFSLSFSENVKYFWSCYRHLILVSNPNFFGMGNHVGPFSWASARSEGQQPHVLGYGKSFGTIFRSLRPIWMPRTGWRGCRRRSPSWSSEILTLVLNIPQTWIVSQAKCSLVCEISSVLHSEPQETHIF